MIANVRGKAPTFVPLLHGSLSACQHHVLEKTVKVKMS